MKNHLGSFVGRLALSGLAVALILLSPALVRADAITTFVVSGSATNVNPIQVTLDSCAFNATCAFSGMFQVDTAIGMVESTGLDITLPGLPAFDKLTFSAPVSNQWIIKATNTLNETLLLSFSTAPTPSSLMGFTGGSISDVSLVSSPPSFDLYAITGGSITPVPEPSSLVLFASGIGLLVFGLTRRFGKKVGHAPSA